MIWICFSFLSSYFDFHHRFFVLFNIHPDSFYKIRRTSRMVLEIARTVSCKGRLYRFWCDWIDFEPWCLTSQRRKFDCIVISVSNRDYIVLFIRRVEVWRLTLELERRARCRGWIWESGAEIEFGMELKAVCWCGLGVEMEILSWSNWRWGVKALHWTGWEVDIVM